MADKSFFSKLTHALLDDEKVSAKDIDQEVETAVHSIKKSHGNTLDGSTVLLENWGNAGDLIYVMDLGPIYEAVGGHTGPMGRRLAEVCMNIFGHHVAEHEGFANVEGELFLMSFTDPSDKAGFRKAADVVNDIGTQMLGERFKTINIPDLVVVTEIVDISDEHGRLSMAKAKAMVKKGGIKFAMEEPRQGDAQWLHERWRKIQSITKSVNLEWSELRRRKPEDSDWIQQRSDRRKSHSSIYPGPERRSGRSRRAANHVTEVDW